MPDPIRGVDGSNPITPTSPTATGQAGAAAATDAASSPAVESAVAATTATDSADVGQTEALLQNIIQAASTTPGIDQNKVAELQQAIASGAYQSNPQSIAQKLVELESLLGTAGQVQ